MNYFLFVLKLLKEAAQAALTEPEPESVIGEMSVLESESWDPDSQSHSWSPGLSWSAHQSCQSCQSWPHSSVYQCFLLSAFAVENRTDPVSLAQEQLEVPEQSYNSVEENTETNFIETKMKEVERPPHLPFFVVLKQSGGKKSPKNVFSSNISKRQGGVLQGLTNVVSNTR